MNMNMLDTSVMFLFLILMFFLLYIFCVICFSCGGLDYGYICDDCAWSLRDSLFLCALVFFFIYLNSVFSFHIYCIWWIIVCLWFLIYVSWLCFFFSNFFIFFVIFKILRFFLFCFRCVLYSLVIYSFFISSSFVLLFFFLFFLLLYSFF